MKASISFPELQNILQEKTEQNIGFSFVDDKTVKVIYPLNFGIIKKDISADLTILEMVGSDLLVSIDAGFGTDTMLNTVLGILKNKIPEGLIEFIPAIKKLISELNDVLAIKSISIIMNCP